MLSRLLPIVVVVHATVLTLCCSSPVDAEQTNDCRSVARRFNDAFKTQDDQMFHDQKKLDRDADVCSSQGQTTCCSGAAERRLSEVAVDEAHDIVASLTSSLRTLVSNNAVLYRHEYVELLTAAENRTCRTLTDDLRLLPVGSAPLCSTVTALYNDLKAALLGSNQVDIHKSVTRFFDELFSLIVRRHVFRITVVDGPYSAVDVQHAACIRSLRRTIRPDPMDGVDRKFTVDVGRAINFSHALLDGLQLASRIVTSATENWSTSTSCRQALTQLRLCALCDGRVNWTSLRPCRGLCINVAGHCLATVAIELGARWERFVDGVARLISRSHGPNDLEFVSKSLDGIVADGVLQVIRNAPHFYRKVLDACGTGGHDVIAPAPTQSLPQSRLPVAMLSRARRRYHDSSSSISRHRVRHRHDHQHQQQPQQAVVGLRQRVEMFTRFLVASRSLYSHLPDSFCSSETLSAGDYDVCWNGTALAPYNKSMPSLHLGHQLVDHPEVNVTSTKSSNLRHWLDQLDNIIEVHRRLTAAPVRMQADDWWTHRDADDDEAAESGSGNYNNFYYYTTFYYYYDNDDASGSGASGDKQSDTDTEPTSNVTTVMEFDFAADRSTSSFVVARSSSAAAAVGSSSSAAESVLFVTRCRLLTAIFVFLIVLLPRRLPS